MATTTPRKPRPTAPITKDDIPRMMTRADVADILGISPGTLKNWNHLGKGPMPAEYSQRKALYFPEDVMDFRETERRKMSVRPPR